MHFRSNSATGLPASFMERCNLLVVSQDKDDGASGWALRVVDSLVYIRTCVPREIALQPPLQPQDPGPVQIVSHDTNRGIVH